MLSENLWRIFSEDVYWVVKHRYLLHIWGEYPIILFHYGHHDKYWVFSDVNAVLFKTYLLDHVCTVLSCITENGLSVMYLLRCSWSIACRHCSNYIFILDLTPGLNGLGKDNYKTRWETFRFWNLVRLILEVLRQMRKCQYSSLSMSSSRSQVLPRWHACQVISWYLMDIFRKKNV